MVRRPRFDQRRMSSPGQKGRYLLDQHFTIDPEYTEVRVGHTSHRNQVTCGRTGHGGRGPPCEAAAQQMKATGDPACRGIAGGAEGIDEGEA